MMKVSKKLILALSCCGVFTLALTGCSLFECKHENTVLENQVTATCLAPGYTGDKKCVDCGEIREAGMSITALEHKISVSNSKEATCKEEGFTGDAVCEVCGTVVTPGEVIAMLQHEGETIDAKEATCQEPGYSGDTKCKLCGEVYQTGAVVDVVDHDWIELEVQKEATCKQEGKHTVECRFCKATMEEKIEKLEHQIVTDPSVEATCTTAGKTEGKRCAVCKTVIQEQKVIKALGHDVVVTTKGTEATCTKDGKASVSRCQRCNEQLTNGETIKAKGHTEVKTAAVAATCSTPGKTEGSSCSVCKTVIRESTSISATGHKNVANEEVPATCEKAGKTGGTHCSVCNTVTVESTEVPATGHKIKVINQKKASCTEEGYTGDEICETCDKTIKAGTVIEKLPHKVADVGNAVAATCKEEGRTSDKICTACQTVVEHGESIPKKEHQYVVQEGTALEATCTEYGHADNSICSVCQDVKEGERTPKKTHTRVEDPETAIEATCQTKGKRADIICADCKKTLSTGRTLKKVDCVPVAADDAVESTCSQAGRTASQICKWCEKTLAEGTLLPLAEHTPAQREGVDSTCQVAGKTAETYCSVCDTILQAARPLDLAPHSPVKVGVDVAATCTQPGIIYGTECEFCKTRLTEDAEDPIIDHSYNSLDRMISIDVNVDTLKTAEVVMQCDGCEERKTFVGEVLEPLISVTPSCTEEGVGTCIVTAKVSDDITHMWEGVSFYIPVVDHTPVITPGIAPTCDAMGKTQRITCEDCGFVIEESRNINPKHNNYTVDSHEWDELAQGDGCDVTLRCTCNDCHTKFSLRGVIESTITETPATCTESGSAVYKVVVSTPDVEDEHFELERAFAAKKHYIKGFPMYKIELGETPSYDLSTGEVYAMLKCEDCGITFKYVCDGKAEITVQPTCEKQGEMTITWAFSFEDVRMDTPIAVGGYVPKILSADGHIYDNEETPDICTRCNTHKSLGLDNNRSWWKGSRTDGYASVETLTIQKEIPEEDSYEESWIIDRDEMGYLKAFLVDEKTVIISTMGADAMYLNTDGGFLYDFRSLTTINGLELIKIDNCETLSYTFANCYKLTEIDISTWTTEREEIKLAGTFDKCAELITIRANKELAEKATTYTHGAIQFPVFEGCASLVGTQTGGEEDVVNPFDSTKVTGEFAKIYFTYAIN